ncbi:MAG: glycosyltransferase [Hyphomicrobiales bacterium]
MRILVVASLYPNPAAPRRGLFVRERVVHVARRAPDVRVIAPVPRPAGARDDARIPERETRDGLPVAHPRFLVVPGIGAPVHGWTYLAALRRAIRTDGGPPPDVVDAHYLYPDGYAAVRFARDRGLPVVVSARGTDVNVIAHDPILGRFVRETLRHATRVVAVSEDLSGKLRSLGVPESRLRTIPNGVDADRFRPGDRAAARRRLGAPEGIPLLLAVGNLVPNKGHHHLVRALAAGAAPLAAAHLWIVGEGPGRPALEREIAARGLAGRVRLVGPVDPDALPEYYAAADLFCLATAREGWPNAVTEALACGIPVVATRTGGIPELVTDGRNGFLVDDPARGLARSIVDALAHAWDRDAIANRVRARTWDVVAGEALAVLREARDERAGAPQPETSAR